MTIAKCVLCGGNVNILKGNSALLDGQVVHKKCPSKKPKLSEEEKEKLNELKECIEWMAVKHEKPTNWALISKQIKDMKEEGYNYEDQLEALKYTYKVDGDVFWGYGRTRKFIAHALYHKKREQDYKEKRTELKKYKPQNLQSNSFMDF